MELVEYEQFDLDFVTFELKPFKKSLQCSNFLKLGDQACQSLHWKKCTTGQSVCWILLKATQSFET